MRSIKSAAIIAATYILPGSAFSQNTTPQPQFEVARVGQSKPGNGRSGQERIVTGPASLTGTGVGLRQLILEAYDMPYSRIFGGPPWLDSEIYNVEAKAAHAVSRDQLHLMLRALLADRFKLALHRETREMRVYTLTVAKNGPNLHDVKAGDETSDGRTGGPSGPGVEQFRCDLPQFAARLALRLNTPMPADPSTPVRSTGVPIPVIDKTGLTGTYDIRIEIKLDPGADPFITWQRALQDQLGLKLESQKAAVEVLVIDHVEKVPSEN
jgi:uncharacterized protein (TIGR03435 family)